MDRNGPSGIIAKIRKANTASLRLIFLKIQLKTVLISSHIWFVRECLRQNLRPNFVNFRFHTDHQPTSTKLDKWITRKWLNCELNRWYGQKNTNCRLLLMMHLRLANEDPDFPKFHSEIIDRCASHRSFVMSRKRAKIAALQHRYNPPVSRGRQSYDFHPPFINLSSTHFSNHECELLSKGLKFAVPPRNAEKALDNLVADISVGVKDASTRAICTADIKEIGIDVPPPSTNSVIRSIERKIKDDELYK